MNREDLLQTLRQGSDSKEWRTRREIQLLWGVAENTANKIIREAVERGLLEVSWGYRKNVAGIRQKLPVFRALNEETDKS